MVCDDLIFYIYVFTNILVFLLLLCLNRQIVNLNHNLYFVFKANGMLWDVSEDSILYTKIDKKC